MGFAGGGEKLEYHRFPNASKSLAEAGKPCACIYKGEVRREFYRKNSFVLVIDDPSGRRAVEDGLDGRSVGA